MISWLDCHWRHLIVVRIFKNLIIIWRHWDSGRYWHWSCESPLLIEIDLIYTKFLLLMPPDGLHDVLRIFDRETRPSLYDAFIFFINWLFPVIVNHLVCFCGNNHLLGEILHVFSLALSIWRHVDIGLGLYFSELVVCNTLIIPNSCGSSTRSDIYVILDCHEILWIFPQIMIFALLLYYFLWVLLWIIYHD